MGQRLIISEEERNHIAKMYGLINEQDSDIGATEFEKLGVHLDGKGSRFADADITVTDPKDPLLIAYKLAKNLNYTYIEFMNEAVRYSKDMLGYINWELKHYGRPNEYGDEYYISNREFEPRLNEVRKLAQKYERIFNKLVRISEGSMGEEAKNYVLGMMPKTTSSKVITMWDAVLSKSDYPSIGGDKWLDKKTYDFMMNVVDSGNAWYKIFGSYAIGPKLKITKKVELVDTPTGTTTPTSTVTTTPEPVSSEPEIKPFCIGGKFIRQNNSYPVAIICSKEKQVYYFPTQKSFDTFKTTPEWKGMYGELDFSGGSFPMDDYNKVKSSVSNANETKTVSDRSFIPGVQGTIEKIWYNPS